MSLKKQSGQNVQRLWCNYSNCLLQQPRHATRNTGTYVDKFSTINKNYSSASCVLVQNMRKALYVQFTVGLLFYYGVTIVGYWAYGSSVSVYLPQLLETVGGMVWFEVTCGAPL
ncbi:hypothetical protein ACOSQ4_025564 [Xanthoceras sorbifolium]